MQRPFAKTAKRKSGAGVLWFEIWESTASMHAKRKYETILGLLFRQYQQ